MAGCLRFGCFWAHFCNVSQSNLHGTKIWKQCFWFCVRLHTHTQKKKLNCRNLHALARFHCSWTILEEAETAYFLGHIQHFHMMTCPCYSISAELGQNIINNKSKMHGFVVFLTQLTGWKRPERETSLILEPRSSAAHKPAIRDKII